MPLLGGLAALAAQIDAGKIKTVVSVGEDVIAAGLRKEQLAKISIVYFGPHANATSAAANPPEGGQGLVRLWRIVIPTLTVFEKSGTFVNQQFRIQKFTKAVPGPLGATDDLVVLARLAKVAATDLASVWQLIAAEVSALATMTFSNLPETGLLLDATPWSALPFVEGESLHFKPWSPSAPPEAGKPAAKS